MLRYAVVSADYFQEIEAHFAMRRGTPFILSAKDWALMKSWADDGVPLPVVIEALDSVFDKAAERKKVVSGLHYCRHAVKELWDERRALHAGAEGAAPEEAAEALLAGLAEGLEESAVPPEIAASFAVRIRELAGERSVPRIEERLLELEEELVSALITDDILSEADAAAATSDETIRARTHAAYVRRLVRERFGLPRLSLF